jgi:YaaC-like protein
MSQTAIPNARSFDGWVRLPVSERRVLLLTNLDIDRELWSILEYYSEVEDVGFNLIQAKGLQPQTLHQEIFKDFQAFVRQAKSYYGSAKTLHYRSSSLLYYYSFLNLVKAYLLLKDPKRIIGRTQKSLKHGLSYKPSTTNTDFQLEIVRVCDGIFPIFYEAQTSNVISTAINSTLNISSLLGYSTDISYQYLLVNYGDVKILPSLAAILTDRPNNHAWTIIGIPATTSLNNFLNLHTNFLNTYQEVQINRQQYHCKIREETQQESGLKSSITEVYSTVLNSLWRQRGCYATWNGQPFTT